MEIEAGKLAFSMPESFKRESFELFDAMIESFKDDTVKILFNLKVQKMSQADYEKQKSLRENKGKKN